MNETIGAAETLEDDDCLNVTNPEKDSPTVPDSLRTSTWSEASLIGGLYLIFMPCIHPSLGEGFYQLPTIIQWVLPTLLTVIAPMYCVFTRKPADGARFQWPAFRMIRREILIAIPIVAGIVSFDWCVDVLVLTIWPDAITYPSYYADMAITPVTAGVLWFVAGGILWVPVGEEIIFRGFLQNAFRPRIGTLLAVLAQSAIFGIVHFYETIPTVLVINSGIVLGAVYSWRKTIICPMVVHSGLNLVAFASLLIAMNENQQLAAIGVVPYWAPDTCVIHSIDPASPAASAGLLANDHIQQIDGTTIEGPKSLRDVILDDIPGDDVSVTVERDGRSITLIVTLCARSQLTYADWLSPPVY